MGIDIYTRWHNMTEDEQKAQLTGFDVTAGKVGYLREAYHGNPYVTHFLLAEAFDSVDYDEGDPDDEDYGYVAIPAQVLRARLPRALELAKERNTKLYDGDMEAEVLKSFIDFVELCERKEQETGQPVKFYASY